MATSSTTPPHAVRGAETPRRTGVWVREVVFLFLAVQAVFPAMWFVTVVRNGPVPSDWLHLKIVADHFVAGDWARLYATSELSLNPGYYWRYPPFALYVVAPLAWLPNVWAYAVIAGIEIAALAVSMILLGRLVRLGPLRREWILAITLSAPVLGTLILGQNSALIMLCVVAAATQWTQGRHVMGGAILGLLAIKPNWGVVFGLCALARRDWRAAAAMAGVALLLCVLALPLGTAIWADFIAASAANAEILQGYDPSKLITLRGFLEAMLGRGPLALSLWVIASAGLAVLAILAWRARNTPLHDLGIAVLLAVAANPYASYYDALVLAVPATVWLAGRHRWLPAPWLTVGLLIAVAWCGEQLRHSWGAIFTIAGTPWALPFSVVGPVAAAWLVLAAHQARTDRAIGA